MPFRLSGSERRGFGTSIAMRKGHLAVITAALLPGSFRPPCGTAATRPLVAPPCRARLVLLLTCQPRCAAALASLRACQLLHPCAVHILEACRLCIACSMLPCCCAPLVHRARMPGHACEALVRFHRGRPLLCSPTHSPFASAIFRPPSRLLSSISCHSRARATHCFAPLEHRVRTVRRRPACRRLLSVRALPAHHSP